MRASRPLATLLTVAIVAVMLVGLSVPVPAAAATPHELRVISHNIAGGPKNKGDLVALDPVNAQIAAFSPDVVMLQEVCGDQAKAFHDQHPTWSFRFAVMVENQYDCIRSGGTDTRQGQLLASPYPISAVTRTVLSEPQNRPYPDGEVRLLNFILLCGDIAIPGHAASGLRACTTHLRGGQATEDRAVRTQQLSTIRAELHDRIWTQGQAVTVGGDLNALADWDEMDQLYRLTKDSQYTGIGDFYEADQTDQNYFGLARPGVTCGPSACRSGQYTTYGSTKIDYVFISRNVTHGGQVSGAAIAHPDESDHLLYRALFNIQY